MSNLSELLPAGAGKKEFEFTASGAISNGDTVVLNTDGTVSVVSGTQATQAVGSQTTYESSQIQYPDVCYDTANDKIVIVYQDTFNSSYGTAVVGTVSGTTITFGTPVVFASGQSLWTSCCFDESQGKVLIGYRYAPVFNRCFMTVGTVSGTSISFGGGGYIITEPVTYLRLIYDANAQRSLAAFEQNSKGTAYIIQISSGSASVTGGANFEGSNAVSYIGLAYNSTDNNILITYRDSGNSSYPTSRVATISGTSVSFGTEYVITTATGGFGKPAFDSDNGVFYYIYRNSGSDNYGKIIAGIPSGTDVTWYSSTDTVYSSSMTNYMGVVYDANAKRAVISFEDAGDSQKGKFVVAKYNGATSAFTFDTVTEFNSGATDFLNSVVDPDENVVVTAYVGAATNYPGQAVVIRPASTSTNNDRFIGIAESAISDTATGKVVLTGGVSENVSGLTAGTTYYVDYDGSLTSTSSESTVAGGKALSSTSILLNG